MNSFIEYKHLLDRYILFKKDSKHHLFQNRIDNILFQLVFIIYH
jgi:hypothetical protein